MDNNDYAKQYIDLFKKIIKQEQKKQSGVTVYYGKVITVADTPINSKCDISLFSYDGNVYDILNKSNSVLTKGDSVVIMAINDSLSNAYISMKMEGI